MIESIVHWLLLNPVLSVSWKMICLSWFSLSRILFVTEEEAGSSRVLSFSLAEHFTQTRQCWKCSSFAQFAIRIFSRKLGEKLWNWSHTIILLDTSKLSMYVYFEAKCTTIGSTNAMNTLSRVNFTPVCSSAVVNTISYHFIHLFLDTWGMVGSKAVFYVAQDRRTDICLYSAVFLIPHSFSEVKVWSVHSWEHFRADNKSNGISEQGCQ